VLAVKIIRIGNDNKSNLQRRSESEVEPVAQTELNKARGTGQGFNKARVQRKKTK